MSLQTSPFLPFAALIDASEPTALWLCINMIVLGQHVLAHHLLNDGVGGGGDDCDDNASDSGGNKQNCNNDFMHNNAVPSSFSITHGEMYQQFEEIWNEARMKVNSQLGLIGAPPLLLSLSSSLGNQSRKKLNVYPTDDDDSSLSLFQKNVECICSMVSTHVQLLQTMICIIEQTLTMGTSISLGLGPIPTTGCVGNGRLVARAEKSWIAKHRQQHHQPMIVKLSLQKLRYIIHQTIIDQTKSLQVVLDNFITTDANNNEEQQQQQQCTLSDTTEWDEFVLDIQQPHIILTLSQLSSWINRLGELLSFAVSTIFDTIRNDNNSLHSLLKESIIACVDYSTKFANERIVYLHSACPLLSSSCQPSSFDSDNHCDTNDAVERNVVNEKQEDYQATTTARRRRRQAESMIRNLQATLDAARIYLWEFEQSHSNEEQTTCCAANNDAPEKEEEVDTTRESWSQFKDMMERSHGTISDFEDQFLSSTFSNKEDEQDAATNENSIQDVPKADGYTNESSEHVSNATIINKEEQLRIEPQYPIFATNKTLVFSGSGIKSQSKKQVPEKPFEEEQGISSLSQPSSRAFNAVDQVMLLQDLQKRIKTMGLVAEEHEVVNMDDKANVGESEDDVVRAEQQQVSTISSTKNRSSQSCFLGVSGSLLAELSSTITNGTIGDVVGGDSNQGVI